jgi:choline transport protein
VTGLSYLLSLMFSVQDYGSLADTHTGLPLAELFWQATSTRGGAFGLVFMVWVALGPCVIGSQLSEYCFSLKDQTTSDSNRYWASILGLFP